MAKNISPQEIQNFLSNVEFPATKQDLLNHARSKNVSNDIMSVLNGLPDREYMDKEDLMKEVESR